MKKVSHFSLLTLLILSISVSVLSGCQTHINTSEADPEVSSVNDVDFKVVKTGLASATVSWEQSTNAKLDYWVISTSNGKYTPVMNSTIDGTVEKVVSGLTPRVENSIYLSGYKTAESGNDKLLQKIEIKAIPESTGPVTNLKSTLYEILGYIEVSWDSIPSGSKIETIVISRKEKAEEDYTKIAEIYVSKSYYDDKTYLFEKEYFYRVETFDADGNSCGIAETTEGITTPELTLPSKVKNITWNSTYADGVTINWNVQPGVEKYIVSIAPYSDKENITEYETTENSFFYRGDMEAETYLANLNVTVSAVNEKGQGEASDAVNVYSYANSYIYCNKEIEPEATTAKVTFTPSVELKEAKISYELLNSSSLDDIYKDFQESPVFELSELEPETKYYFYYVVKIAYTLMDGTEKTYTSTTHIFSFTTTEIEGAPETVTGLTYTKYGDGFELSWDAQENVIGYKVFEYSSYSAAEKDYSNCFVTTEPAYFIPIDISKSFDKYYRVCAVNEIADGKLSSKKYIYMSSSSLNLEAAVSDEERTSATVTLELSLPLKNATAQYALCTDSSGTEIYKAYQDSPVFNLTDLGFGSTTKLYGFEKITYEYEGSTNVKEISTSSFKITTKSFPAPAAPSVEEVGRKSATVSFTPLTTEQLYGIDASKVVYQIQAYRKDSAGYSASFNSEAGSTAPVKITGLFSATTYQFTIRAFVDGEYVYGDESEESAPVTTNAGISQPVIKTVEEVSVSGVSAPYSVINVTFDPVKEDEDEEILYGLEWEIFQGNVDDNTYTFSSSSELSDITSAAIIVNGGNRYFVSLYAYAVEEGIGTKVRSEAAEIQLAKIDDTGMSIGFYYNSEAGEDEGKIVDIVNSKSWESSGTEFTPRSTLTTYNWGLISQQGDYVVKFGLTDDMLAESGSDVKLYYVQQYYSLSTAKINSSTLASQTTTYFVAPDTSCSPLVCFADYSSTYPYSIDPWNMPAMSASGTISYASLHAPSKRGITLDGLEKYMFNNGLYIGIHNSSDVADDVVGISYYYY